MPGAPGEYRCGGENGAAKGSASRCSRLAPGSHSLCASDGAVSKVSLASPLLHGLPSLVGDPHLPCPTSVFYLHIVARNGYLPLQNGYSGRVFGQRRWASDATLLAWYPPSFAAPRELRCKAGQPGRKAVCTAQPAWHSGYRQPARANDACKNCILLLVAHMTCRFPVVARLNVCHQVLAPFEGVKTLL